MTVHFPSDAQLLALPSSSLAVSQVLPQFQILYELLHCHLIQEDKVRLPKLQALQLRHPRLPFTDQAKVKDMKTQGGQSGTENVSRKQNEK